MLWSVRHVFTALLLLSAFLIACTFWLNLYESTIPIFHLNENSTLSKDEDVESRSDPQRYERLPNITSGSKNWRNNPNFSDYVREILSIGLEKIEENVLGMDIGAIVGPAANVSFLENRLLAKIQGLYRQRPERCVIRVAIHCGSKGRCLKFQSRHEHVKDVFSWHNISCLPSMLPCDIERLLVDKLTPGILNKSDVVILGMVGGVIPIDKLVAQRPPGQLWVFMTIESPIQRRHFVPIAGNPYNLTMHYTLESDLYSPYAKFHKTPVSSPPQLRNKTKLMAWMASHCTLTPWKRFQFVKYLKQYIDIDVYGKCGDAGKVEEKDLHEVLQQYKFYLALENNECRDYITEKVHRNSFRSGTVPIVYGSRPQDYARIFPANSYIHLQDFDSLGDFIDFIHALDSDVEKYNRYFDWWNEGIVRGYYMGRFLTTEPGISVCYVLRKMVHIAMYPETSWQKKVPHFGMWQRQQCPIYRHKKVLGFSVH